MLKGCGTPTNESVVAVRSSRLMTSSLTVPGLKPSGAGNSWALDDHRHCVSVSYTNGCCDGRHGRCR